MFLIPASENQSWNTRIPEEVYHAPFEFHQPRLINPKAQIRTLRSNTPRPEKRSCQDFDVLIHQLSGPTVVGSFSLLIRKPHEVGCLKGSGSDIDCHLFRL